MSISDFAPYISGIIAAAALIYTIIGNRSKKHEERMDAIVKMVGVVETQVATVRLAIELRVDKLEDRATKAEATIEHLPDLDSAHRLELALSELRGEMRALTERIKPIAAISDRIQDAVLDRVTHAT